MHRLLSSYPFYSSTHLLLAFFAHFFEIVLPALGGKHNFKSCMQAKSSKNAFWAPQVDRKNAMSGVLIAPQSLQNPLENVYFCFLGPLGCAFRVPSTVPFVLSLFHTLFSTDFSSFF